MSLRGRDVFQLAQHAVAAVGDRVLEQQPFLLQLDVVGALGGRKTATTTQTIATRTTMAIGVAPLVRAARSSPAPAKLRKLRQAFRHTVDSPGGLRLFGARPYGGSACRKICQWYPGTVRERPARRAIQREVPNER